METNENHLLSLIEHFDFEDLSAHDREWVLLHYSEENYRTQRDIVAGSVALFEEEAPMLQPNPATKMAWKKVGQKASSNSHWQWLFLLFNFRMPAYQLAIVALLFFFPFFKGKPEIQYVEKEVVVYQPKTDTVFIEKELPVVQTKFVEVTRVEYVEKVPSPNLQNFAPEPRPVDATNSFVMSPSERQEHLEHSFGNTSFQDGALDALIVQID